MPIRVSYTGSDGSVRSVVASNPFEAAEKINKLTGGQDRASGLGGGNGFAQNADGIKTSMSGSVKSTVRGIELDGDQRLPAGNGPAVYARKDGRRGWYRQDELDPKDNGRVIGDPTSNDVEAQGENRSENDNAPFITTSISRLVIERKMVEDEDAETKEGEEKPKKEVRLLWAFYRDHAKTGDGREFRVSEERRVFIGEVGGASAEIGESFTKVGGIRFKDNEFQVRMDTVEIVNGEFVTTEGSWQMMEGGETVAHSTAQY